MNARKLSTRNEKLRTLNENSNSKDKEKNEIGREGEREGEGFFSEEKNEKVVETKIEKKGKKE